MNSLKKLNDFKSILSDYQISEKSKSILSSTPLVLLVATTSSGRNTILRELVKTGQFHYIVSDTTRKPRINDGVKEKNGTEYWFKSEDEFLKSLKNGEYIEAAIIHNQQVSGISVKELQRAKQAGKIPITDIEVIGVENIVKLKNDTTCIFVVPPDFKEWQRRIQHRGYMDSAEYKRRLQSALSELQAALEQKRYIFVINDTVDKAVDRIQKIVKGQIDQNYQQKAKKITKDLFNKTKTALNK